MQVLNGFVKIHRKLIQWGWYQDNVVKGVFLHLLLTANFKEMKWQGITINAGQVVTSYKHLAEDLGFGVRQVRTALTKLKSTSEITIKSTNKYTLITVVNWEEYQCLDVEPTSKVTSRETNERQTTDKQPTNNRQQRNNDNNDKERKEYIYCAFFDSLWELYPNKKGKSKVTKKTIEELHKLGYEKVKQCIDSYVLSKPEWQQWQNGSTFFNGGYKDFIDVVTSDNKSDKYGDGIEWEK